MKRFTLVFLFVLFIFINVSAQSLDHYGINIGYMNTKHLSYDNSGLFLESNFTHDLEKNGFKTERIGMNIGLHYLYHGSNNRAVLIAPITAQHSFYLGRGDRQLILGYGAGIYGSYHNHKVMMISTSCIGPPQSEEEKVLRFMPGINFGAGYKTFESSRSQVDFMCRFHVSDYKYFTFGLNFYRKH